ncbi:MAG: hypothetical protein ACF8R7_07645 [Phycisphaerales bacterium JB039]
MIPAALFALDLALGTLGAMCMWAPLLAITAILAGPLTLNLCLHPKLRQRLRDTRGAICPDCGYPLTDIAAGRCPECGEPWTPETARSAWQRAFGGLWTEAFRDPPKGAGGR